MTVQIIKFKPTQNMLTQKQGSILTPEELASVLRVPVSTIGEWRRNNTGPEYVKLNQRKYSKGKLGSQYQYRFTDLINWVGSIKHWPSDGERFLTTDDVAIILSVSTSAVRKMRERGTGPRYIKLCGVVRYLKNDVKLTATNK